jgi:hypothetical protein
VVEVFGDVYLREINMKDTQCLLSINKKKGFFQMLGSIDCMYLKWKNRSFAWQGHYSEYVEGCTIIIEAVDRQDLWF